LIASASCGQRPGRRTSFLQRRPPSCFAPCRCFSSWPPGSTRRRSVSTNRLTSRPRRRPAHERCESRPFRRTEAPKNPAVAAARCEVLPFVAGLFDFYDRGRYHGWATLASIFLTIHASLTRKSHPKCSGVAPAVAEVLPDCARGRLE